MDVITLTAIGIGVGLIIGFAYRLSIPAFDDSWKGVVAAKPTKAQQARPKWKEGKRQISLRA